MAKHTRSLEGHLERQEFSLLDRQKELEQEQRHLLTGASDADAQLEKLLTPFLQGDFKLMTKSWLGIIIQQHHRLVFCKKGSPHYIFWHFPTTKIRWCWCGLVPSEVLVMDHICSWWWLMKTLLLQVCYISLSCLLFRLGTTGGCPTLELCMPTQRQSTRLGQAADLFFVCS